MKDINVAMVSKWHVHAPDFAEKLLTYPGVHITAVWDEDLQRGQEWADELGAQFFPDYEALLDDESIDGVVVCAATMAHDELILRAAEKGKHIFVEKAPFGTVEGAYRARDAIRQAGVKFLVSDPIEKPHALYIRELIDAGKLGHITNVHVRTVHAKALDLSQPPGFYSKEEGGGGAMMDMGCHGVHTLQYFLGDPVSCVSVFDSMTDRAKEYHAEDNAAAIFQFKGGSIGIVETGWVSPAETYLLDVCGTKGSVHVHGRFELYECFEGGQWEKVPENAFPEPLTYPLLHWVQCIQTDSAINRCTIDDAVIFTEMLAAAYRAEGNTTDVR